MLELGELYESLGLDAEAGDQYARFREALARDEDQGVDGALLRGRFEADHGDPAVAVGLLDAEWARSHRSAAVADALGWALHRSGDPSAALEYAARAVDTGGRSASYAYHLGVIQKELGRYGPARRNLAAALRTNPRFSPLAGPAAQETLDDLAAPPPDSPRGMRPPPPEPEPQAPEPQAPVSVASAAPTTRAVAPETEARAEAAPKPAPETEASAEAEAETRAKAASKPAPETPWRQRSAPRQPESKLPAPQKPQQPQQSQPQQPETPEPAPGTR